MSGIPTHLPRPCCLLGDARENVDYFPGNQRHAPGAKSFGLLFVNAAGDTFTAILVGRIHDIVPTAWNRRCLVLASPTDPTYRNAFSKARAWSSNVADLHFATHPRNRPPQIGDNVECVVALAREEFRSGGTPNAPVYKMVHPNQGLVLVAIDCIESFPPNTITCTMPSATTQFNFLGDYEYLRHFFPGQERQSADGRSYMLPYIGLDGAPFLTHIEGRVMDILPMGHRRESYHSKILVLSKPIDNEDAQTIFKNTYKVAADVVALDRSNTARVIFGETAWCSENLLFVSLSGSTSTMYRLHALEVTAIEEYIPLHCAPVLNDSLRTAMSMQRPQCKRPFAGGARLTPPQVTSVSLAQALNATESDEEASVYLSHLHIGALFRTTFQGASCLEHVLRYVRAAFHRYVLARPDNPTDPTSPSGYFGFFPVKLVFTILSLVTMPERVRIGATCRHLSALCAAFMQCELETLLADYYLDFKLMRFLVIATKSLMTGYGLQSLFGGPILQSDTIDLYTTPQTTGDVLAFMMLTSDYTPTRADVDGPWNAVWVLRRPLSKIRVVEFSIHHLNALLTGHMPHRMGSFDGDFVRHPYAALALDRLAIATPYALPLRLVNTEHKKVWSMLHKAIDHGFGWAFEYDSVHACGVHPCCPATLRTTADAGWAHLRLPRADYGSAPQLPRGSWSLCGTGCAAGGFKGVGVTAFGDEDSKPYSLPWGRALIRLLLMDSFHHAMLTAFMGYIEAIPNPLWKAMPYVDYAWSHRADLTVVAVARNGDVAIRLAAEKLEFVVFGVVQSKQYEGYLHLSNPKWHGQGLAGSVLTTHYNEQLLALARALESHGLEAYHDTEDIVIKTDNLPPPAVGSCIFATVTLTLHWGDALLNREEYYTLDLVEAKGTLPLY
ncbi:hypothetical protein DFH06DRAFT_1133454 [Mycena polygramma]|nr:hypothetical protein DFH06DRAFT_1133454 [Mycena polygramma]